MGIQEELISQLHQKQFTYSINGAIHSRPQEHLHCSFEFKQPLIMERRQLLSFYRCQNVILFPGKRWAQLAMERLQQRFYNQIFGLPFFHFAHNPFLIICIDQKQQKYCIFIAMTHSYGYKRRTRHKFAKAFRRHGAIHISNQLTTFKIGDIVDIRVDGAIHKGMPYKYYHGRTGRVFNVNPRAVGVIVNKQVRNRIIPKRINVRIEHLKHSTSRIDFLNRIKENDKLKCEANKKKERISTKRIVKQPSEAIKIAKPDIQLLNPKIHFQIV